MKKSALGPVGLVAGREIRIRIRNKSFVYSTLVLAVVVVGLSFFSQVVGGSDEVKVGYAASYTASDQFAAALPGQDIEMVAGGNEARVTSGDLDAYLSGTPEEPTLTLTQSDTDLERAATVVAQGTVLNDTIERLGGDPQSISAATQAAGVNVVETDPRPSDFGQRAILGFIVGIILYISLIVVGTLVAQGVVEEKTSRIVEILLSAMKPWQLMAGKVLGISATGLVQVAVVGAAGLVGAVAFNSFDAGVSGLVGAVLWMVVWYLVGITSFALLFAGAAALVSRQEDVGSVIAPLNALLIIPYLVGATTLMDDPENPVARVLSFIPLLSPTLMPWRIALDVAPLWEQLLSLGLSLAAIPFFVLLAARIYKRSILRTGQRTSIKEALKG